MEKKTQRSLAWDLFFIVIKSVALVLIAWLLTVALRAGDRMRMFTTGLLLFAGTCTTLMDIYDYRRRRRELRG